MREARRGEMRRSLHFAYRSGEREREGGGGRLTDEVRVIRREFVVQLDGVRLVDGVPERGPASNDRVDVFRAGGSGRNTRGPLQSVVACWRMGGGGRSERFF